MNISLHPAAAAELKEAAAFYTERANKELGLAFIVEFERSINLLGERPELGAVWRGTIRRLPLRRFPHSLIYRLTGDTIQILAIAHQRRRPGYWTKRL